MYIMVLEKICIAIYYGIMVIFSNGNMDNGITSRKIYRNCHDFSVNPSTTTTEDEKLRLAKRGHCSALAGVTITAWIDSYRAPKRMLILDECRVYPLVICYITNSKDPPSFSWVNPLFPWPFSIVMLVYQSLDDF